MSGLRPPQRRRWTGGALTPLLILFGLNAVDELDRKRLRASWRPNIRDAFGLDNQGVNSSSALVAVTALLAQVLFGYFGDRRSPCAHRCSRRRGVGGLHTPQRSRPRRSGSSSSPGPCTALGRAVNDPTHRLADRRLLPADVRDRGLRRPSAANRSVCSPARCIGGLLACLFGWRAPFLVFWIPTAIVGRRRRRQAARSRCAARTSAGHGRIRRDDRHRGDPAVARRVLAHLLPGADAAPHLALAAVPCARHRRSQPAMPTSYEDVFRINEAQRGTGRRRRRAVSAARVGLRRAPGDADGRRRAPEWCSSACR